MTLSPEQQAALDQLLAHVPSGNGHTPPPANDALHTWLGISSADVKARLLDLLNKKDDLEARLLDLVKGSPLDSAFGFLLASAWAFYAAEKDANPRIKTFIDAFYYIATCASVGYADIFALTQPGRAIASLVMILGPALTNAALDRPAETRPSGR